MCKELREIISAKHVERPTCDETVSLSAKLTENMQNGQTKVDLVPTHDGWNDISVGTDLDEYVAKSSLVVVSALIYIQCSWVCVWGEWGELARLVFWKTVL